MVVSLNSRLESDQEADKYGLFMQFHRISRRGVSDPPSSPGRLVNSFQSLYLDSEPVRMAVTERACGCDRERVWV